MANAVHVVLQEDVDNLGASGEVVRVRPGYARNYLIPRGLAVPATRSNLARIEELKRIAAARVAGQRSEAEALKLKLEAVSVRIERVVGEDEKMYGSVTTRDVHDAFRQAGVDVDRKRIVLPAPLKEVGSFEIPAKLYKDVVATLRVEVAKAPEKGATAAAKPEAAAAAATPAGDEKPAKKARAKKAAKTAADG
jgi:large subunit ribosomal protein L9